jgi:hypothetical protein
MLSVAPYRWTLRVWKCDVQRTRLYDRQSSDKVKEEECSAHGSIRIGMVE